jgi:hypothetical protein
VPSSKVGLGEVETATLVVAGFGGAGGALLARLGELGASLWPLSTDAPLSARWHSVECADPADELRRAACWCREELVRNPEARLLVVDTRLKLRRAQAVQAFEHELHASEVLGPMGEVLYGIEGGQPLADFQRFLVVGLGAGEVSFPADGFQATITVPGPGDFRFEVYRGDLFLATSGGARIGGTRRYVIDGKKGGRGVGLKVLPYK